MNIDLNLYKIFYIVAKKGCITKAAEQLYITQPAITQAIQSLEKQIGATLFIRTPKGVQLTQEAKVLFAFVEKGINYIQNGENKFKELMNIESGTLKIGASTTITQNILLEHLERFHEIYPKINIIIINDLTEELINLLRDGSVDLLILNLPVKEYKELEIIPFLTIHDIFAVGEKNFFLSNSRHEFSDLKKYDLIFQKNPSSTRNYLDKFLAKENIELIPKYEVVSFELVKDMTKIGLGVGYLTREFVSEEIRAGKIKELKFARQIPAREIGVVTLKNVISSFAVRAFLKLLKEGGK